MSRYPFSLLLFISLFGVLNNLGADPVQSLRNGNLPEVRGARPQATAILLRDSFRWTPLMVAAGQNPNPEVIQFLLDSGENVDARSLDGWTALMFASAFNQNPLVIRTLVQGGAKVDDRTPNNWNFLYGASRYLDENIIQAVIPPGEPEPPSEPPAPTGLGAYFGGLGLGGSSVEPSLPSIKTQQGWSPIFFAARFNRHPEIYQTLVELGADPNTADEGGMIPLDYAREFNPGLVRIINP